MSSNNKGKRKENKGMKWLEWMKAHTSLIIWGALLTDFEPPNFSWVSGGIRSWKTEHFIYRERER